MSSRANGNSANIRGSAPPSPPNWWQGYLVAIAAVALATVLRLLLTRFVGGEFPFITFFASTAFAAWYAGLGPAIVAVVLGYLSARYFFLSDYDSTIDRHTESAAIAGAITFLLVNGLIAALASGLRQALLRASEAVRGEYEQRSWLEVTFGSIGDAVIVADADGRVTLMNPVAEQMTGWRLDAARGRPLAEVFHIVNEYTRALVDNPCDKVIATGTIVGLANHTILIAKDGSERPIDDSAAPIKNEAGRLIGVVLVFRDVAERRRQEAALKEYAERLRLKIQAGRIGVWDYDPARQHVDLSERMCQILGVSQSNFQSRYEELLALVHPDDRQRFDQLVRQTLDTSEPFEDEFRLLREGGLVGHFSTAAIVVQNLHGERHVHGAARDTTEQNRTREVLEFLARSSASLAALVDRESTLRQSARLLLPFLADWCAIHLVGRQGDVVMEACAHVSPEQEKLLCEILSQFPLGWNSTVLTGRVLHTGEAELIVDMTDALAERLAVSAKHLEMLQQLGIRSFLAVPIRSGDRVIGALEMGMSESARRYRQEDVQVALDFADRVAAALSNAQLVQALQHADRQKDDFLAMLAHELRNPLAAIQYANALAKSGASREDFDTTQVIERQVSALSHLIDDLLDVSRITRGKIALKREYIDAAIVVRRAVATVRPALDAKRHQLITNIPDVGSTLHADPVRLEQTIVNLLSNAVKYTPDEGVIHLTLEESNEEAVISVRDNGVGIPQEMLAQIFEMFAQVDPSLDRSQGGLGIGLTVVRQLIELHGGTVMAASEGLGAGTSFVIRLPIAKDAPRDLDTSTDGEPAPPRSLRVLVVDDNRDTAISAAMLLDTMGHVTHTAFDGTSGLQAAREFKPDMCLLDIGLPGMNGYQLASALRNAGFRRTVLVAISGYGQQDDRERSRQAGFDHHVTKPIALETLRKLLSSVASTTQESE